MPTRILKSMLKEGADFFGRWAAEQNDVLMHTCGLGLQTIVSQLETYEKSTQFTASFLEHLRTELCRVCEGKFPSDATNDHAASLVQEAAFCLIEDIALIMREKKLRDGCTGACAAEEELLSFFEGSGYWKAGDGTLVTDTYFVQLPVAVLHELLQRSENRAQAVV